MTEPTRVRRSDGVVQGYHTRPHITSNADARAAFNPRPSRPASGEQSEAFLRSAAEYRAGNARHSSWNEDVARERGLPLEVVDDMVERHVHRELLDEYGDPRKTEAFAAAVEATRKADADTEYWWHISSAAQHARHAVTVELLRDRTSPGHVLDAAVDEVVFDAARN